MRYLRLFESFESYYEEIDPRGSDERLTKPFANLTKLDIDSISEWLVDSNLGDAWDLQGVAGGSPHSKLVTFEDYSNTKNKLTICKTEDEWFGVVFKKQSDTSMSSGRWFICDQLSGIKKLIGDLEKNVNW